MLDSMSGRQARVPLAAGFTLIELMVTLVVAAVILGIAVPNFTGLVNSSRLTAQANELVTGIQLARSEAIKLNRTVNFCGSADGTNCAAAGDWTRWVVRSASDVLHTGEINPATQVNADNNVIAFRPDGLARLANGNLAAVTVTVCMAVARPAQNIRQVTLANGSRTNVAAVDGQGACP